MADPSSPAALLRQYGLRAKKSWGQCFLHDPGVVRAIVAAAGAGPEERVLEIGAGLGVLTEALAGATGGVVAVERDRDLCVLLRRRFGQRPGVQILEANALTLDLGEVDPDPLRVVGNLPYNISSQLLFHLLGQRQRVLSATLMFQKELAQRLVAAPGSRVYGAPSVICQRLARLKLCLSVPRGAFFPSPRVDSAVVRLDLRPEVGDLDDAAFSAVVRAAFARRRKTLRRALAGAFPKDRVEAALEQAGVAPQRRAETLDVAEFERLARALQ